MVDEGEGGVCGAPDSPRLDNGGVAAAAVALLGDDGLVGVEVGAAHEVVEQLGKEQLLVAQSRGGGAPLRDEALELEAPQEEDGHGGLHHELSRLLVAGAVVRDLGADSVDKESYPKSSESQF